MNNTSNKKISLVIVCRDIDIHWEQFANPIYVGVETGAIKLIKDKLPISFAIGDFDNLNYKQFQIIKNYSESKIYFPIIKISSNKDFLDSELAIIEAQKRKINFSKIVIISEGDRWDMVLAQINLMRKYLQYRPLLLSSKNYSFILNEGEIFTFEKHLLIYKYISIFVLNAEDATYSFTGCKYYPGKNVTINNYDVLAISNEFTNNKFDSPMIKVLKGQCLILLYKEK